MTTREDNMPNEFPNHQYRAALPFHHDKNIEVGHARVIYVEPSIRVKTAGWALPGGRVETDFSTAMECAMAMNNIMSGGRA